MLRSRVAWSSMTGMRLFRVSMFAACLALASVQVALSASPIQQLTNDGASDIRPVWSPAGTRLSFYVYRNGTLDLWSVGVDGSNARPLTNGLASEQKNQCTFACHVAPWSPDGSRLAYSTAGQAEVWTMRASDGSDAVRV